MTALQRPAGTRGLTGPFGVSVVLHALLLTAVLIFRAAPARPTAPMYRVDLVAAPPGPRAIGVVTEAPAPPVPAKSPPRPETKPAPPKVAPKSKTPPAKAPVKATPNVTPPSTPQKPEPAPKAGGGAQGGAGTDVATVRTEGIAFPFPGYLNNIVRQIALNFNPRGNVGALRAEVFFMIRRDGTVTGFKFLTRSGMLAFDLEAQGAVESAARAFGALPAGFNDDVLPVIFSFDPSKLK